MIKRFHLMDGLCFTRLDSGDVLIEKFKPTDDCFSENVKPEWNIEIKQEYFASVVASMSLRGETWSTWKEALDYHNKSR